MIELFITCAFIMQLTLCLRLDEFLPVLYICTEHIHGTLHFKFSLKPYKSKSSLYFESANRGLFLKVRDLTRAGGSSIRASLLPGNQEEDIVYLVLHMMMQTSKLCGLVYKLIVVSAWSVRDSRPPALLSTRNRIYFKQQWFIMFTL